jgi:hypothetical protein
MRAWQDGLLRRCAPRNDGARCFGDAAGGRSWMVKSWMPAFAGMTGDSRMTGVIRAGRGVLGMGECAALLRPTIPAHRPIRVMPAQAGIHDLCNCRT